MLWSTKLIKWPGNRSPSEGSRTEVLVGIKGESPQKIRTVSLIWLQISPVIYTSLRIQTEKLLHLPMNLRVDLLVSLSSDLDSHPSRAGLRLMARAPCLPTIKPVIMLAKQVFINLAVVASRSSIKWKFRLAYVGQLRCLFALQLRLLKFVCKCHHFPIRCRRKQKWVALKHSVYSPCTAVVVYPVTKYVRYMYIHVSPCNPWCGRLGS